MDSNKPWYRHLWPWLLMIPPGAAVTGGVTILFLALNNPYDLAVLEYDQIEDITALRFSRDAAALERGLTAQLELSGDQGEDVRIIMGLTATTAEPLPDQLVIEFKHATRDTFDATAELIYDGDHYRGEAALATGSRYQVEVYPIDHHWRLAGILNRFRTSLTLSPQGIEPPL